MAGSTHSLADADVAHRRRRCARDGRARVRAPARTRRTPNATPVPSADDQSAAQNAADLLTAPVSGKETQDLPNVAMSSQIVFQVLAAEVALQRGQPAPAYQTYLALARDTHDPRFAQRATEIAIAAQSPNDALTPSSSGSSSRRIRIARRS